MPTTILVTAATGKVSSRVIKLLIEEGGSDVRVVAGAHNPDKAKDLAELGASVVPFDFDVSSTVEEAVAGVDKIFLLTPGASEMMRQADAVLSAAESAGIKYVVRLSVIGADAEPGISLTRWHRSIERGLVGSGLTYTFLRPNGFMQNFESSAATIKSQNAIYYPDGMGAISYIDANDIARVAAKVLLNTKGEYDGHHYELTGPEALTFEQIAGVFSKVLGREIKFVPLSFADYDKAMADVGMPPALIEVLSELNQHYQEIGGSLVSNAPAAILGRSATTFEQYVRDNREKYE